MHDICYFLTINLDVYNIKVLKKECNVLIIRYYFVTLHHEMLL